MYVLSIYIALIVSKHNGNKIINTCIYAVTACAGLVEPCSLATYCNTFLQHQMAHPLTFESRKAGNPDPLQDSKRPIR